MSGAGRVQLTREAVVAAAMALQAQDAGRANWGEVPLTTQGHYIRDARAALEAATPHLVAFPMGMTQDEWEKHVRSYR